MTRPTVEKIGIRRLPDDGTADTTAGGSMSDRSPLRR